VKVDFEDLRLEVRKAIATRPLYKGDDWQEAFIARAKWVCWFHKWAYEDYWKERQARYGR
jgi:hypothetical protein